MIYGSFIPERSQVNLAARSSTHLDSSLPNFTRSPCNIPPPRPEDTLTLLWRLESVWLKAFHMGPTSMPGSGWTLAAEECLL